MSIRTLRPLSIRRGIRNSIGMLKRAKSNERGVRWFVGLERSVLWHTSANAAIKSASFSGPLAAVEDSNGFH